MTQHLPPASIESALPSLDANLTLKALLEGYAQWWCGLPSISGYSRHYSTDGHKHLVIWEGYAGSYDSYGDFGDDDRFYNEVVKGVYRFWHVAKADNGAIRVWGIDYAALYALPEEERPSKFRRAMMSPPSNIPGSISFEYIYPTLAELRAAMISQWGDGQATLGEQGEALRKFTATFTEPVRELLRSHGEQWLAMVNAETCHYRVFGHDHYTYLVLWNGAENAVVIGDSNSQFTDGRPKLNWDGGLQYAELRIGLKRLPIRFQLERRQWRVQGHSFYKDLSTETLKSFEDLQVALTHALENLQLTTKP